MKNRVVPLIAVLVIAISAVSFAAGAFASIPDADGVIHACYRKSDGRVRVVNTDKGQACVKGERALDWNRQGRRGPKGAPADPGIASAPITEHIVASCTSLVESPSAVCSVASWTQPPNTVGDLYFRVHVTAPGGACQSGEAANVGTWKIWLNDTQIGSYGNVVSVGPGETETVPAVGSDMLRGLLPGQYALKTGGFGTIQIAPDCTGAVVETEVFVETVASG